MITSYGEIAFGEGARIEQEKYGSRRHYERIEKLARGTELSFQETDFIERIDGFYLASVGDSGFPYVQFRGGPPGFLKVLDSRTLGFADFRGNRQYVTVGNLTRESRVALILMDYARRQRLKIFARMETADIADAPALARKLEMPNYQAKIERAMTLRVAAFDWNCPQHITPRYTISQIQHMLDEKDGVIARLEQEIEALRRK